jgi:ethanolamine utilization protein EutA
MKETILSVGIDIGTSTTQIVFCEIFIENMASVVSVPRMKIIGKRPIYTSDIYFTPLISAHEIDTGKVRAIVEQEYQSAGVHPDHVGTGAVIITGESARKVNAARVIESLSSFSGEFVVATAGPALEGIIAAKGAHAHIESKDRGAVVANLDIVGGTTNIAVFKNGNIIDTPCLDIGGRLVQFSDDQGTVSYASEKIKVLANSLGIVLEPGVILDTWQIIELASEMASILEQSTGVKQATPMLEIMATDKPLRLDYTIDYVSFSGGVADCMGQENIQNVFAYGDLGIFLGKAITASRIPAEMATLKAKETIRATLVGAGSYTTDISGSTVTFTDDALPVKNIPILKLSRKDEMADISQWGDIIAKKIDRFALKEDHLVPALAFTGPETIGFDGIQELASSIVDGMRSVLSQPEPLIVVVENDLAKALGQALKQEFPR